MKFKLGQKVKYKKIIRRHNCSFNSKQMGEENFTLTKRDTIEISKIRTGYIMGKRKLVLKLTFGTGNEDDDGFAIICKNREWKKVYVIAYNMGKTNYVLEEDLKEVK